MTHKLVRNVSLSLISLALTVIPMSLLAQVASEFRVVNDGSSTIIGLEIKENGSNRWQTLTLTNGNLTPGTEATFVWSERSANSDCVWSIRAIYADGTSEPSAFDFCTETSLTFEN